LASIPYISSDPAHVSDICISTQKSTIIPAEPPINVRKKEITGYDTERAENPFEKTGALLQIHSK